MKPLFYFFVLGAAYLMSWGTQASAAEPATPPAASAARFSETGKIDSVDILAARIIVADGLFKLPSTVSIYTNSGKRGSLSMLKKGVRIAFNIASARSEGRKVITEILVLDEK